MAAQAGFAPAPFRLTDGRTTVIPLSSEISLTGGRALRAQIESTPVKKGLAEFAPPMSRSLRNWSPRQELHLRSPGPRPGMLLLHYAVLPRLIGKGSRGLFSLWRRGLAAPWGGRRVGDLALSMGLAPTLYPQTTGCFSIQLREPFSVQSVEWRVQSWDHEAPKPTTTNKTICA